MKIAAIVVRILMGLMFVFASVTYFIKMGKQPEPVGNVKLFMDGLTASNYLMPLAKTLELLCGIALLVNRFVKLAVVVIFPIVVNIMLINMFLMPSGLIIGLALFACNLFLAWYYREAYVPMLAAK